MDFPRVVFQVVELFGRPLFCEDEALCFIELARGFGGAQRDEAWFVILQTSLNDLDKAEEVSKLRSPEMAVFSAGFRSTIPDCRLEKHCLPGWQCGRRWLA